MTNAEFADVLERLAAKYRENGGLAQMHLMLGVWDRESLRDALRSFGGKGRKRGMDDTSEYASLYYDSDAFPPFVVYAPRNIVCRRIVTYDCDPIMSPEEEAEVLA